MWVGRFEGGGGYILPACAFISSLGAEAEWGEADPGAPFALAETSRVTLPGVELVEGRDGVWATG